MELIFLQRELKDEAGGQPVLLEISFTLGKAANCCHSAGACPSLEERGLESRSLEARRARRGIVPDWSKCSGPGGVGGSRVRVCRDAHVGLRDLDFICLRMQNM